MAGLHVGIYLTLSDTRAQVAPSRESPGYGVT